jgi:hypothetical protein
VCLEKTGVPASDGTAICILRPLAPSPAADDYCAGIDIKPFVLAPDLATLASSPTGSGANVGEKDLDSIMLRAG